MRAAVEEREHDQAAEQSKYQEHRATGARADGAAAALLGGDQVDGSHPGTCSVARPAAIASRSAETEAKALSSMPRTDWRRTARPRSASSASAKPDISSAGPLRTTLVTSPPPSWERWKSSELRTSPTISRMPFSSTARTSSSTAAGSGLAAAAGSGL